MSQGKHRLFTVLKWLITLAAYGFLVYKLARIEYWEELRKTMTGMNLPRMMFLLAVLLLMPVNWMLESRKWQFLTSSTVAITFKTSLKAVLAGLNTGFITPNRYGEFAGRIFFLPEAHRWTGVLLSFVNSVSQSLVVTFFGLIGAGVYFSRFYTPVNYTVWLWVIIAVILICTILYLIFPGVVRNLISKKWFLKLRQAAIPIAALDRKSLLSFIFLSIIRYVVFCGQFYFMLKFFGIDIPATHALSAIPAMYLLVTYTPSFAASDPAIRGSYAVLIFSVFSGDLSSIMLTGILIWLINFVVPMLVGSVIILRSKS